MHELKITERPLTPHTLPLPPKNGCSILPPHGKREIKMADIKHSRTALNVQAATVGEKAQCYAKTELKKIQTKQREEKQETKVIPELK